MLSGIDVSSWQGNIQIAPLQHVDFVMAKATEGTYYVNPMCDPVIQQCIKLGKLWGVYHFLSHNDDAVAQANFFIDNITNYIGNGILAVDWEATGTSVAGVNAFVDQIKKRTNIWPLIYSWPRWFSDEVNNNCGRWIANYPEIERPSITYDPGKIPTTSGLVAMWQYASDGQVPGYNGNLDVNKFYGDSIAWHKYAQG